MKHIFYWCILIAGIAFVLYSLAKCNLWGTIIALAIYTILILILLLVTWGIGRYADKREKEVINYLNECDRKLKNGEMSEEENKDIHFYYEMEFNC